MNRVNNILCDEEYKKIVKEIEKLETTRIYCHHDMVHFLDVARIARIICNEEEIECELPYIYAAALLHDIGRAQQYVDETPHEEASFVIAKDILERAGFGQEESELIRMAIREHGNEAVKEYRNLTGVIYRADKLSRKCFYCEATDTCHKAMHKRNMEIKY